MGKNFELNRGPRLGVALLLFLILVGFFLPSFSREILIALLLGGAYVIGLLSLLFGIVASLWTFVVSLPIVSTVYAYAVVLLSRIHTLVFRILVGKVLRKMGWYRRAELRIRNSPLVKRAGEIVRGFLGNLGLEGGPRRVRLFEVAECRRCGREIPADGVFCPYCGGEIGEGLEVQKETFQLQFQEFHAHMQDLVCLEALGDLSRIPGYKDFGENRGRLRHPFAVAWHRAGLLHDIGYDPDVRGILGAVERGQSGFPPSVLPVGIPQGVRGEALGHL
jgi:hypothetical protein